MGLELWALAVLPPLEIGNIVAGLVTLQIFFEKNKQTLVFKSFKFGRLQQSPKTNQTKRNSQEIRSSAIRYYNEIIFSSDKCNKNAVAGIQRKKKKAIILFN